MNTYCFSEVFVGQKESFEVTITEETEKCFRNLTGDCNPLHHDDAFACEIGDGRFKSHVIFGMLTASYYSTLAGVYLPGKYSLIHSMNIKFQKPVYPGDTLTISGEITDKQEELKLIQVKGTIRNQNGQNVSKADMKVLVLK